MEVDADSILNILNTAACCALALVTSWACLSAKVHDGIIIKIGLIFATFGFSGHAWITHDGIEAVDAIAMIRAQLLINAGVVTAVLGWLARGHRKNGRERRATDFVDLDPAKDAEP
jgi:hypothetical protein